MTSNGTSLGIFKAIKRRLSSVSTALFTFSKWRFVAWLNQHSWRFWFKIAAGVPNLFMVEGVDSQKVWYLCFHLNTSYHFALLTNRFIKECSYMDVLLLRMHSFTVRWLTWVLKLKRVYILKMKFLTTERVVIWFHFCCLFDFSWLLLFRKLSVRISVYR